MQVTNILKIMADSNVASGSLEIHPNEGLALDYLTYSNDIVLYLGTTKKRAYQTESVEEGIAGKILQPNHVTTGTVNLSPIDIATLGSKYKNAVIYRKNKGLIVIPKDEK